MKLYTEAELAAIFEVPERTVEEWRRQYGWPHVKVGRRFRYTQEHVEQIVEQHTRVTVPADPPAAPVEVPGQTPRSSRRRSA